jgi:hypothetical protein
MISAPSLPAALRPNLAQSRVQEHRARTGLLRAVVDARFPVTLKVNGIEHKTILSVRDRALFPRSLKAKIVCLHATCAGKEWDTEAAMRDAHPSDSEMQKRGEAHVFAAWSNDAVNPPDPNCAACIGEMGKPPKACAEHAGGVVGLVSTGEA